MLYVNFRALLNEMFYDDSLLLKEVFADLCEEQGNVNYGEYIRKCIKFYDVEETRIYQDIFYEKYKSYVHYSFGFPSIFYGHLENWLNVPNIFPWKLVILEGYYPRTIPGGFSIAELSYIKKFKLMKSFYFKYEEAKKDLNKALLYLKFNSLIPDLAIYNEYIK